MIFKYLSMFIFNNCKTKLMNMSYSELSITAVSPTFLLSFYELYLLS